jgi:hypothetical protein
MTPLERHNAMAKSMGAPIVERPSVNLFPVTGMTNGTAAELARRDAKAPPPSQAALKAPPAPGDDPGKLAAFDAEMRAKGLQRAPDGTFQPSAMVEVDQAALEALDKAYRAMTPKQREANRAVYRNDLRTIYEGRRNGETLAQFQARRDGTDATPLAQSHTPQQWQEGHKSVTTFDGFIPLERINVAGLSGYTLPKLIEGQQYRADVFSMLADARAAGLTQAQVDAYIRHQMKREGHVK